MVLKIHVCFRLVVFILLLCGAIGQNLCSLSKLDNTCRCEYRTCEVTHFPELYADCRWIELDSFPKPGQLPEELRHLDLAHNDIDVLRNSFSGNALIELVLSYNKLDYIDYAFFENLRNIKILDLSHNSFEKLDSRMFSGLSKLTTLDLSYNKLTTIPENVFTPLSSLQNLNLGYNDLGKFFEGMRNMFEADMDLTENLLYLNLDNLGLKKVPSTFFGDVEKMQHLSLADNLFDDIPRIPSAVRHFDFSGNNVTMLTVQHLDYHDLKILHLNRMKNLQAIDKYALYNMPNLEELYMESCPRLRELNSLALGVIRPDPDDIKLKRFSLARSGLQSLNQTYMHLFKRLDFIDLQNNPFTCDCAILWMQLLNGSFYRSENMRCASPVNLRNKKIMELTSANLPNCLVSPQTVRLQKVLIPVLAVIVMLLLVLIVYLIYMGPFFYKTYRTVSPESPYQEATMLR